MSHQRDDSTTSDPVGYIVNDVRQSRQRHLLRTAQAKAQLATTSKVAKVGNPKPRPAPSMPRMPWNEPK